MPQQIPTVCNHFNGMREFEVGVKVGRDFTAWDLDMYPIARLKV
jgi:hypothetical protein